MRILLVGGGSGGHVTPLKAVAKALQAEANPPELSVMSDFKFGRQAKVIFADMPDIKVRRVVAGKLRRYNSKPLWWHFGHLPTLLRNFRDLFLISFGFIESFFTLLFNRPDVIFCKGGYVGLPVGVAAFILGVPLLIHDSDTHPGLTNRILARWAETIATGMPTNYYHYPASKMHYVGIPVDKKLKPVNAAKQAEYKQVIGSDLKQPLVLVTGGSLGAERLNQAVIKAAPQLLARGWGIVQVTGKGKAEAVRAARANLSEDKAKAWQVHEFVDLVPFILAADIIVSRTGASAMQEFANAKKAVITVPSRYLTGGHQLKNAAMFKETEAAIVLDETELEADPSILSQKVIETYQNQDTAQQMASNLYQRFGKSEAATQLAALIISAAR